jgi:hypothetical protein|nr:MAG TPA: hypothetical protein [Caudoviricetes sp.]
MAEETKTTKTETVTEQAVTVLVKGDVTFTITDPNLVSAFVTSGYETKE